MKPYPSRLHPLVRTVAGLLIAPILQASMAGLWLLCASDSSMEVSHTAIPTENYSVFPREAATFVPDQARPCPHHGVEADLDPAYLLKTPPLPDRRVITAHAGKSFLDLQLDPATPAAWETISRAPPDLSQTVNFLRSIQLRI